MFYTALWCWLKNLQHNASVISVLSPSVMQTMMFLTFYCVPFVFYYILWEIKRTAVILILWLGVSIILLQSPNDGLILCLILAAWEFRGAAVSESAALKEMTCTLGLTSWHSEIICQSWGGVDRFLYQWARREILVHSDVLTHPTTSFHLRSVYFFSLK